MTTYQTGNPLGSSAVKDIYDNATNFDLWVNSTGANFADRFGQLRETMHGAQSRANVQIGIATKAASDAVAAAGAIGPIAFYGTYADAVADIAEIPVDGLVEIAQDETRDGARTRYRKSASDTLEFSVNLDMLRTELTQPNGFNAVGGFLDPAGLRTYSGPATRSPVGTAYFKKLNASDRQDNGITLVVDADGKRWQIEQAPAGYPRSHPLLNEEIAKLYANRHQLMRAAATGGYNSVIQGVAYDPVDEQIISTSGGGTDGRGHSVNIFTAGALGDLNTYVWNRSTYFGHQGIGVCRMRDGAKTLWLSRNYNDQPNTGNLVTSFNAIRGTNTDSIVDGIIVWKVFPDTSSAQSTTPNISSCGRYLVVKKHSDTEGTVRVFDVQKMWANRNVTTDYSTDYLYEIKYQRPFATDGIATFLQGLACDGQYVYVLEHKPGLAVDSRGWVYVLTLDGVLHSRVEITNVGRDLAIANSPNPALLDGIMEFEGAVIFGSGEEQSIALALCTSWPEMGVSAKRAYVLELGKQSVSANLKAGVSSTSQSAALTSGSAYGVKYSFGVPGGFNWGVHPTRKGILTNGHDPLAIAGVFWSGIQVVSTGTEGMSNLLLGRLTDDAEASRHIFYKSRSANFTGSKALQSTDRLGRIAFYGDIGGGPAPAQLGAEWVTNVRVSSGAAFSASASLFLANTSGAPTETLYTHTEVFRPQQTNTMRLGDGAHVWTTGHFQNAPIVVSDEDEKTSIEKLTAAEKRVGQRLRELVRTFQYNSAVAIKGPNGARTHVGWIAQHVKAAFEAEGLDGLRYGCLCLDIWEDQAEVLDADGRVITKHLPAGQRYGVREAQILAFVVGSI